MKCPRCGAEMNGICNNCGFPMTKKKPKILQIIAKSKANNRCYDRG